MLCSTLTGASCWQRDVARQVGVAAMGCARAVWPVRLGALPIFVRLPSVACHGEDCHLRGSHCFLECLARFVGLLIGKAPICKGTFAERSCARSPRRLQMRHAAVVFALSDLAFRLRVRASRRATWAIRCAARRLGRLLYFPRVAATARPRQKMGTSAATEGLLHLAVRANMPCSPPRKRPTSNTARKDEPLQIRRRSLWCQLSKFQKSALRRHSKRGVRRGHRPDELADR